MRSMQSISKFIQDLALRLPDNADHLIQMSDEIYG